jgi:hypothetical protein
MALKEQCKKLNLEIGSKLYYGNPKWVLDYFEPLTIYFIGIKYIGLQHSQFADKRATIKDKHVVLEVNSIRVYTEEQMIEQKKKHELVNRLKILNRKTSNDYYKVLRREQLADIQIQLVKMLDIANDLLGSSDVVLSEAINFQFDEELVCRNTYKELTLDNEE